MINRAVYVARHKHLPITAGGHNGSLQTCSSAVYQIEALRGAENLRGLLLALGDAALGKMQIIQTVQLGVIVAGKLAAPGVL